MTRIPSTPEQRAEVVRMAPTHTPKAIAAAVGLNLGNVYRLLSEASVTARRQQHTHRHPPEHYANAIAVRWQKRTDRRMRDGMAAEGQRAEESPRPAGKPIPLEVARSTFGARLRIDEVVGGLFLDGSPIRYSALMRRVNEQHVAWGQPQPLKAVPEWVVAENG